MAQKIHHNHPERGTNPFEGSPASATIISWAVIGTGIIASGTLTVARSIEITFASCTLTVPRSIGIAVASGTLIVATSIQLGRCER